MSDEFILQEKINCFSVYKSEKISFLIDAENYFHAFYQVASKAQNSILICGWDVDGQVDLLPQIRGQGMPSRLKDFLIDLCRKQPQLKVYILCWDYSILYASERDHTLKHSLAALAAERIYLTFDPVHPFLGCHHEKYVVIDGRICFLGGIDLCSGRWDNSHHQLSEPRRCNARGESYSPVHDMQIMVEGVMAATLAQEFKFRWRHITGQRIELILTDHELWPKDIPLDLAQAPYTGPARTRPKYGHFEEVTEIKRIYLECIDRAKSYIYIENQYLTCKDIEQSLQQKLLDPQGPEVILVLSQSWSAVIEYLFMGSLQLQIVANLQKADKWKRLRIVVPVIQQGDEQIPIKIHSKLLISDHNFLFLGSANLNNRSMGLDTECNFALEARDHLPSRQAIMHLLAKLLGEHLGLDPLGVESELNGHFSLCQMIDKGQGSQRTLQICKSNQLPMALKFLPITKLAQMVDPQRPLFYNHTLRVQQWERWSGGMKDYRGLEGRSPLLVYFEIFALIMALVFFSTSSSIGMFGM